MSNIENSIKEAELKRIEAEKDKIDSEKREIDLEIKKKEQILKLPVLLRPQSIQVIIGLGFFTFLITWVYQPLSTLENKKLLLENEITSTKNQKQLDSIFVLKENLNKERKNRESDILLHEQKLQSLISKIGESDKKIKLKNDSIQYLQKESKNTMRVLGMKSDSLKLLELQLSKAKITKESIQTEIDSLKIKLSEIESSLIEVSEINFKVAYIKESIESKYCTSLEGKRTVLQSINLEIKKNWK